MHGYLPYPSHTPQQTGMTRRGTIHSIWLLAVFAVDTHVVLGSLGNEKLAFALTPRRQRVSAKSVVTPWSPGAICSFESSRRQLYVASSSRSASRTILRTKSDVSVADADSSSPHNDLRRGYRACRYASLSAAAMIFATPDQTMTTLLATKWGGAIGFALAGGLCHVLESAAASHRLGSDTYKRLNLGLLAFGGMGMTAIPGEAAFLNSKVASWVMFGFLAAVRLLCGAVAFVGWTKGISADSDAQSVTSGMLSELAQGTRETIQGLRVKNSKKALAYRNCLVIVLVGILSSFMEGMFNVRYQTEFTRTWFETSLHWSAVARLTMIASMIYSLKDAAERDRLMGTTFIELNLLLGSWAVLVGLGQAIYPLGFAAYRGVLMFAFAVPFFLKAYRSHKEKQGAEAK